MSKIDLLELDPATAVQPLEIVRLGENEMAVVPFTSGGEELDLHYCDDSELRGYIRCNGPDCPLCLIGRKVDTRILLPVYLPTSDTIGVLLVSKIRTPHALLPQLLNSFRSGRRELLFIRRGVAKFTVTARPFVAGEEDGSRTVKEFLAREARGEIVLESLVTTITNEDLSEIPGIARHLALKGAA